MPNPPDENALGKFLRERRRRLDPGPLGLSLERRRTPGLRREEVALRAHVSPAWYTWLEQGRGGFPSADVLDRLARGLDLNPAEREFLFLLAGVGIRVDPSPETVDPGLQRLLDSLEFSPAMVRTSAWDVVAANAAARLLLAPGTPEPSRFNVLENFFLHSHDPDARPGTPWWEAARSIVAGFRLEAFRAGFGLRAREVVSGLVDRSVPFAQLWNQWEISASPRWSKTFLLAGAASASFESTTFAVQFSPGLTLLVFTPVTDTDRDTVKRLLVPG